MSFFFYFSACSHQAVPPSTAPCKAVIPLPIQSSARTLLISSNQLTLNICFIPPVDPTGVFILVLFFYFFFSLSVLPLLEFALWRCFFYARVVMAAVVCALIYLRLVLFQGEICANKNCRTIYRKKMAKNIRQKVDGSY